MQELQVDWDEADMASQSCWRQMTIFDVVGYTCPMVQEHTAHSCLMLTVLSIDASPTHPQQKSPGASS
jgi:hypothetical protein